MNTTAAYADFSIKARCSNLVLVEQILRSMSPVYLGEDLQTDTYFSVPIGKMKLRTGNIERLLTHYLREEDQGGKMKTTVFLYERNPSANFIREHTGKLRQIGQVIKSRRIFFIGNVKFHLDTLGDQRFVEIEAIDRDGTLGIEVIREQADKYRQLLGVTERDIVNGSYIDMLQ